MNNYIKVFEHFDKKNNVYINSHIGNIENQHEQPYTQTINYFSTFNDAKLKISSIFNFSIPEINKRIEKETNPTYIKKFGDKIKDKLGISTKKVLKIQSLSSLGIVEKKENTQLFHYLHKNLIIAKIIFDTNKVHNRPWKLIFYYYDKDNDVKDDKDNSVADYKDSEINKQTNITYPEDKTIKDKVDIKKIDLSIEKTKLIMPYIDNSKKAIDYINKNISHINIIDEKEIEIGDMTISKKNNKDFKIIMGDTIIDVKDSKSIQDLNKFFDDQSSDNNIKKYVDTKYTEILLKAKKDIEKFEKDIDLSVAEKNKKIYWKYLSVTSSDKSKTFGSDFDKISDKIHNKTQIINSIKSSRKEVQGLSITTIEKIIEDKILSLKSIKFFKDKLEKLTNRLKISDTSFFTIIKNELDSIIELSRKESD